MKNKTLKYFTKYVRNFFSYHLDKQPTEAEVQLLYDYTQYLNRNNYAEQVFAVNNVQHLAEAHCEGCNEPDQQGASFIAGINTAVELLNSISYVQTDTIHKLTQEVKFLKKKNKKLQASMLERINKLEQELKLQQPTLAIAHQAYNAALNACEPNIKLINGIPTAKIHHKYNFRTWCNKIWKYGKAKPPFEQGRYLALDLKALQQFNELDLDEPPIRNKPLPKPARRVGVLNPW